MHVLRVVYVLLLSVLDEECKDKFKRSEQVAFYK